MWCPWMGFGGFLRPCWGSGTGGRVSSVKLPLDHVDRDVKKVACEDDGDSEGVTIPKEGQKVGGAGLAHR